MNKFFGYLAAGISGGVIVAIVFSLLFNSKQLQNVIGNLPANDNNTEITDNDNVSVNIEKAAWNNSQSNNFANNFVQAAETTVNAVVHIKSQMVKKSNTFDLFFYDQLYLRPKMKHYVSTGSGVIITENGYIVTNHHVVDGADAIVVTLNNKSSYNAQIIGIDPSTDLALIKIDENNLPYIDFANSNNVKVGEWALAVGNPFNLTSTVTAGIISAKARNIHILPNGSIESFIQTDAAVNRGNSGGALVNVNGELIGINAAIASETGSYAGYSFAIPSNLVKKVVNDLLKYGKTYRAYMGINVIELNSDVNKQLGTTANRGIYVSEVIPRGSAFVGGIQKGDIISKINNFDTSTFSELQEIVQQHNPGDNVSVEILRNNKKHTLNIQLRDENGNISLR